MEDILVGVDVGGTFTDAIYIDSNGYISVSKVSTTPTKPEIGIANALRQLVKGNKIQELLHATTIATNAILGQVGLELPNIALLVTYGFRDIIEIGRQNRPKLYDLFFTKPKPLVSRKYRYEIKERTNVDGKIIKGIDEREIIEIANEMLKNKIESVAISYLHSYINPENEIKSKEILSKYFKYITISHDIAPEPREYERTSTTVVNAALRPIVSRYIEMLSSSLEEFSPEKIYIMSSSGGLVDTGDASQRPVQMIESGPAAGAIAAAELSKMLSIKNSIGFDMGGTTAKASAIINGKLEITTEYEVGGEAHHGRTVKGSGYPVRFPFIDLAEVSAGGGTVIWRDEANALRVGPISVGADPGPASYGKGGDKPSITDANFFLGRIGNKLAGGEVNLNLDLAKKALSKIGDPEEVSISALELINLEMARAVRLVTVERGLDPSSFSIIAFGGAGPQHAAMLAEELGSQEVIVPPEPGLFSALGLLMADSRFEARVAFPKDLQESFEKLEKDLIKKVGKIDYFIRLLDVRYKGQGYELTINAPENLDKESIEKIFSSIHYNTYGFVLDRPIEIVMARIFGIKVRPKPKLGEAKENIEPKEKTFRKAYISKSWDEIPVYDRDSLPKGFKIDGPAIIDEYSSTIVIPKGWRGEVGSYRTVILRR
ncbi:N-methylhydantoinase A/acetone carboxylase, beta subunit [Caldisphaera lagunensis DSM 15908]|uniref:N-methylhydantoinase A/acetone carboxylase, beta subunit n=1 Tax=Caldisphaera lagunensis (strain DSM 15908 / JCM 11604 / ANMR 0165 / IC-154) TaxID=1056495 RepID=L0A905_CALLD|nr:hydantoinase/oxoprolinase family protein [Caldisphaera lagunensis]AFZ70373.1 N-methylhydantoinase A/acetone carboxylase, beta subunit [Caldisphaera lagunensis DSM 15908]